VLKFVNTDKNSYTYSHMSYLKTKNDANKLISNWGAWAVIGFFNFLKSLIKMAFGKK